MIPHVRLAAVIGVWTAVTWGGRIGLLAGNENLIAKVRIAVSLAVAIAAVAAILSRASWMRPVVGLYSATTSLIWATSVISVLGDSSSSLPFKLVHLALAAVSIFIAVVAWRSVVSRPEPEQERLSGVRSPADR